MLHNKPRENVVTKQQPVLWPGFVLGSAGEFSTELHSKLKF